MSQNASAWCSALLIIAQMVTGPVAHPVLAAAPDGCGTGPAASAAHPAHECDGCGMQDLAGSVDAADDPSAHAIGCTCSCPCGHTPALAMPGLLSPRQATPGALGGEPKGPTFTPPLFDFLRPPN